jgi:2,3-dihydroxy-2,3-dihydrophenylpropionate dehydrogenase
LGSLEGSVALVTGGASGIGRGVVDAFVKEGASVSILDISQTKIDDVRKTLPSVKTIQGDATKIEDNEKAVRETLSEFGKLDVLVCCPALFDYFLPLSDFPKEKLSQTFDEIFAVNVKSYLLSTKAALDELLKNNGNIVYTSSNASFYPEGGGAIYTASKFAVRGLVKQMAFELAPKVRVNGVAPGGTVTDLRGPKTLGLQERALGKTADFERKVSDTCPLQTVQFPEDHAYAYVYLASRKSGRVVTGTIIHTDGGIGVRGITKVAGMIE